MPVVTCMHGMYTWRFIYSMLGSSVENRVVSLSVGASLTAACTESGDVYMWYVW